MFHSKIVAQDSPVTECLIDAIALVERGWCQHQFIEVEWELGTQKYCPVESVSRTAAAVITACQAVYLLDSLVPINFIHWNDQPGRTKAEVIAKMWEGVALSRATASL